MNAPDRTDPGDLLDGTAGLYGLPWAELAELDIPTLQENVREQTGSDDAVPDAEAARAAISRARRQVIEADATGAEGPQNAAPDERPVPPGIAAAQDILAAARRLLDHALERVELAAQAPGAQPADVEQAVRRLVAQSGVQLVQTGHDVGPVIVGGVDVAPLLRIHAGHAEVLAVLELADVDKPGPSRDPGHVAAAVVDVLETARRQQDRLAAARPNTTSEGGPDAGE